MTVRHVINLVFLLTKGYASDKWICQSILGWTFKHLVMPFLGITSPTQKSGPRHIFVTRAHTAV